MAGNLKFLSKLSQSSFKKILFVDRNILFQYNHHRNLHYVQGQSPEQNRREYFYYIDHQGMLFLDDSKMKNFTSCFKEKKFLLFFFQRLRRNDTGRYEDEFPFVSPCGRERNYIRCDDTPIVYTHVISTPEGEQFCHNHAGDVLKQPFECDKIYMSIDSGRIYHPTIEEYGGFALIQSKTAIEFSKLMQFRNGEHSPPTHIMWGGNEVPLNTTWINDKGIKLKKEFSNA